MNFTFFKVFQSWNEVGLSGEPPEKSRPQIELIVSTTNNVYVWYSYFQIEASSSSGGAISFTSPTVSSQILIEECIFFDCHTTTNVGGAIFMGASPSSDNGQGNFVINKCCSNKCSTSYTGSSSTYGQFCRSFVSDDETHINKILDSSVIYSESISSDSRSVISFYNGVINIKTVNFSQNKCLYYPSAFCEPTYLTETTCFVELCSFKNNTANVQYCIYLSGISTKDLLKSSNLIGNNILGTGLVAAYSQLTVEGCTILENEADSIFFCYSGSITVINCTITEEDVKKTNNDNVNIENWTPKHNSFINGIKPTIVNEICSVGYDTVGTLTPNLPNYYFHRCFTCNETFLIFTHRLIHTLVYSSIIFCLPFHSNQ